MSESCPLVVLVGPQVQVFSEVNLLHFFRPLSILFMELLLESRKLRSKLLGLPQLAEIDWELLRNVSLSV